MGQIKDFGVIFGKILDFSGASSGRFGDAEADFGVVSGLLG